MHATNESPPLKKEQTCSTVQAVASTKSKPKVQTRGIGYHHTQAGLYRGAKANDREILGKLCDYCHIKNEDTTIAAHNNNHKSNSTISINC